MKTEAKVFIENVDVTEHIQLDALVEGETYYPILRLYTDDIGQMLLKAHTELTLVYPGVDKRNPITKIKCTYQNVQLYVTSASAYVYVSKKERMYNASGLRLYTL